MDDPVSVVASDAPAAPDGPAVADTPVVSHDPVIAATPGYPPIARAIYALALFIFVYLLYFADTQLVTLLVAPIEHAYGIDDTHFSLLAAAPPVIAILAIGLPMAALVDRWNRRNLLAAAVLLWTNHERAVRVRTRILDVVRAQGRRRGRGRLVLPYCGIAIIRFVRAPPSDAGLHPTATVRDERRRNRSHAERWCHCTSHRLSVLAVGSFGPIEWWRYAFILVSVPAPLGAALLFTIREPRRHLTLNTTQGPAPKLLPYLKQHWAVCAAVIFGTAVANIPVFAARSWLPEYFARAFAQKTGRGKHARRSHPDIRVRSRDWRRGPAGRLVAPPGSRKRQSRSRHRLLHHAGGAAGPAPFVAAPVGAALVFGAAFLLFNLHGGPQIDIIQGVVPNEIRGRFVTLVLMVSYLGAFLGPFVVGLLDDHVFNARSGIRYSMSVTLVVACIVAAFCWSYRARSMLALLRGGLHD